MAAETDPPPPTGPATKTGRSAWMRLTQPAVTLLAGEFARTGYLAAFDQGLISVSNFLAAVYLARYISPTEFGVYAVGFLALHLVRAFQEGLVVQPISALGAAMDARSFRPYASATAILQILLAVATALLAVVGGWLLTRLGNDTAGPAVFGLWFAFLTWSSQEFIRRTFYARGDVVSAVFNTSLASLVRLGALFWFGSRGELSGGAGLDAIGWGALAAIPLGLWQARTYWTRRSASLVETMRRNWAFGRWVLGGTLANWASLELYPILTAGMISFAAAGAYRALQNPVAPVHVLLRATDTLLTPRAARTYSRHGYGGLRRTLRFTYLIAGLPILGLLVAVSLYPRLLLSLLYGDTYLPYSQGMVLMAVFYGLWFLYWPLMSAFKAVRRTVPIFVANLVALGTMSTLGLWAIRRWGVYGTIVGQALNALIVAAILWGAWLIQARRGSGRS
jgi:O-antigen/teichoic acid export membrane protein